MLFALLYFTKSFEATERRQTGKRQANETNEEEESWDPNHKDPEEHPRRAPVVHAVEEDAPLMMVVFPTGNFTLVRSGN